MSAPLFLLPTMRNEKISPKMKFFGQALKILENKHFGMDMLRGRPQKSSGPKNFGLIFRSLHKGGINSAPEVGLMNTEPDRV